MMTAPRQLASITACVALATTPAFAVLDILAVKQAEKTIMHTGEVTRVEVNGVSIKLAIGEIKIDKPDIKDVQIEKRPGVEKGKAALRAHQYQTAVSELKPIVDALAGMPLGPMWIEEAVGDLGDAYLGDKKLDEAQKAYDAYAKMYPNAIGPKVKKFRVLAEKKAYKDVTGPIKEFLDPFLKKESLSDDQEPIIAEALIVQGDCLRASNQLEDALDSYLLAVSVFNLDADLSAQAKFNASQVFEQKGNWNRARSSYEELITEASGTEIAANAKIRLEALNKAHPK